MRLLTALSCAFAVTTAAAADPPAPPQRMFISGHSLIDNPVPPDLARIAESLGQPLLWNRQYIVGSAIKYRSRGYERETGWSGYSDGDNREGQGLNVIKEFLKPATTDGKPYDTLIITEQDGVLDSIVWQDTLRYLRHYQDRFIAGNARGQTWFYEPWLGVIDKSDPTRWIDYERSAAPLWQCVVDRVNLSLAAEGRADRIKAMPASLALAAFVERAVRGQVPGLPASNARQAMEAIFHDQIHLKPLGAYYMALSTYASVYGKSPVGAWSPDGMSPVLAASLQRVAWETVSTEAASRKPLPLAQCAPYLLGLKDKYFEHMRDDYWVQQPGSTLRLSYQRLKHNIKWRWQLWHEFDDDPFRYDAATDKQHWLPAP